MNVPLYTPEILRLAVSIPFQERLLPPCSSAERRSAVCGSVVRADVELGPDGRVIRFGQQVEACALGQASAAILGQAVLGLTVAELAEAHRLLDGWLKGEGALPAWLGQRFGDLLLFEAARAVPGRHPSILIAFEAAATAAARAAGDAVPGTS